MKKLFALLFTAAVTFGTAAMAHAQELKVVVPFDFEVNGTTLPAATYSIGRSLPNNDRGVVFMGDHRGTVAEATELDGYVTGAKLVFHKAGDEYFLSDVVTINGTLHFAATSKEKKLARAIQPETVTIAAGD